MSLRIVLMLLFAAGASADDDLLHRGQAIVGNRLAGYLALAAEADQAGPEPSYWPEPVTTPDSMTYGRRAGDAWELRYSRMQWERMQQ